MPVQMHFSTFLKLLTLDTGDKIRQLTNYTRPGGFDFYRSLREATIAHTEGQRSVDEAEKILRASAGSNTLDTNLEIFHRVAAWLSKQSGTCVPSPRAVWPSPAKQFTIVIAPEISIQRGNEIRTLAIYPRRQARLNGDKAGAAIILMQQCLPAPDGTRFGILDVFGERAHHSSTNYSSAVLAREIATIDDELARLMG